MTRSTPCSARRRALHGVALTPFRCASPDRALAATSRTPLICPAAKDDPAMTRARGWLSLVALTALSVGMPRQASATWSIVAVDPRTREVGAAGASCTPFVVGIVGLA